MKVIACTLAACALAAAMATPAGAQSRSEKQKAYAKRGAHTTTGGNSSAYTGQRPGNGYVEYNADKMRFGSSAWWEQMRREGRLGGEVP